MIDCSNVEMREMLPELVHEALAPAERAALLAHLATCAECSEELALLRDAERAMRSVRVPVVDTAAIVAALPRPRVVAAPRPLMRRSPTLLRLAAAISFISVGGISVAVARSYMGEAAHTVVDSARADAVAPAGGPSIAANIVEPVAAASGDAKMIAVHPSIAALDDADLESLLGELDDLEAAPMAEPETTPGGRALAGAVLGSR